jgi:hypothetical protein
VHSTDSQTVHAKSRLKKVSRLLCGDHPLPAAATPHPYARSSQSHQAATVSPTSTQVPLRLALHPPVKALRTRLAEDVQAPYLHDSLQLVPALALVARSHHLVPRARRTPRQAASMALPHQLMSSSKLRQAPPILAARLYFHD